jgi:8-oxo-dGTP diphosphatase
MLMVPGVSAVVVDDVGRVLLGRRATTAGGARVNDDESLEMRWFATDALPDIDDWVRLRIDTALKNEPAAWFAAPGAYHPALGF